MHILYASRNAKRYDNCSNYYGWKDRKVINGFHQIHKLVDKRPNIWDVHSSY
jgi:hypothetical protein